MKKDEVLKLFDLAIATAEKYGAEATKILKSEELTDRGREKALESLKANQGAILEATTSRIAEITKQAVEEVSKGYENQAKNLYSDADFVNTLQAWKVTEPSEEVIKAIAEKFSDNPIARGELKQLLKGEASSLIPGDERAYYFDLMAKAENGIRAIDRNAFSNDASTMFYLPFELASRKDFYDQRLDNDLRLIRL